jgi:hypothetical protein
MSFVIPTKYKGKLPHTHSYPIGAEALSLALADVPQLAQLGLSFHYASQNRQKLTVDGLENVLIAAYRHFDAGLWSSNASIERGLHEEIWELTVYAVRREERARVKELLMTEGLPRVTQWLSTPRSEVWRYGHKWCAINYAPLDDALVIHED